MRLFQAESQEAQIARFARDIEQAGRDIVNLQRQMVKPTGDPFGDAGESGGAGGAIAGTLTSTLSRGGTATLSTGHTITDNTEMPGTIVLPVGTRIKAVLDSVGGTIWHAIIPGHCYRLRGTLPATTISSGGTGTVTLSNSGYGTTVTARNRKGEGSPTGSRGCMIQWEEVPGGTSEWLIDDWNCL